MSSRPTSAAAKEATNKSSRPNSAGGATEEDHHDRDHGANNNEHNEHDNAHVNNDNNNNQQFVPLTASSSSTSSASAAAVAAEKAADAAYDKAVNDMLEKMREDIMRARPANPTEFISSMLAREKIVFPEAESCKLIRDKYPPFLAAKPLTIVVFGASGDLAKKKTFPALFGLFCNGLLPRQNSDTGKNVLTIVGFARSSYTQQEFHDHLRPLLEKSAPTYKYHVKTFLSHVRYVQGESYSCREGYRKLENVIEYHESGRILPMNDDAYGSIEQGSSGATPSEEMAERRRSVKENGGVVSDQGQGLSHQQSGNRLFYLALPPTAFIETCTAIKENLVGTFVVANSNGDGRPRTAGNGGRGAAGAEEDGSTDTKSGGDDQEGKAQRGGEPLRLASKELWARVVVEKPFGHDTKSSNQLADALNALFTESQIFRIDHYLGKEMVQNIVSLRFANHVFSSVWSRHHIHSVQIVFKEKIGTEGRGGYFDKFGIIRDVIQNHLCQILALVGMEKPKTLSAEDVRDEKVALLRCVAPVDPKECVIGQYTAAPDGSMKGYKEDDGVPKDSKTPTFASMLLHINNDRWDGVPFIIKAGKAVEDKAVTVRIQFRDELRPFGTAPEGGMARCGGFDAEEEDESPRDPKIPPACVVGPNRNELVIRAQPDEAMYLKINTKNPGMGLDEDFSTPTTPHPHDGAKNKNGASGTTKHLVLTELDLTYGKRYNVRLPEAYESLVNEAILGNSTNFVRRDELDASWRIFTPLLHAIDKGMVPVREYAAGSRGPKEADELVDSIGFRRSRDYSYKAPKTPKNKL